MAVFRYWNENPNGESKNDCVTRAIAFASGLQYEKVRRKLFHTAKLLDCYKLCWSCYAHFIAYVLGCRQVNCDGMTVEEFANKNPQGTYLIRIDMHLTAVKDGVIYDIFDCRNRRCHIAWEVR